MCCEFIIENGKIVTCMKISKLKFRQKKKPLSVQWLSPLQFY